WLFRCVGPGRRWAYGPTFAPGPITLSEAWVRVTTAFSPTSTSIKVVSGPIRAPAATDVAPSRDVPGSKTTSGARSTEEWTHVDAGSTTVTPSRIQRCRIRL